MTAPRLPVIVIVGRPNVGKSTLFNYLTGTRDALVADEPGMTRDRQFGLGRIDSRAFIVVDTGGFGDDDCQGIAPLVARQAIQAIDEADAVLFMTDGRAGLSSGDAQMADWLRRGERPLFLAVNKSEGRDRDLVTADFHQLGCGPPWPISAAHGQGIRKLMEAVLGEFSSPDPGGDAEEEAAGLRVAIVGRPNVGKSTLVNRIVGEERVLAFDEPGTTRDSIDVPFSRDGRRYVLVDTAGVRRRARVDNVFEKFSVVKTLKAIEAADVVVLLVDAREGVTDQDAHLLGHVLRAGRGLVIAANKWDHLATDRRDRARRSIERRFGFVDYVRVHFISALHGTGVGELFGSIDQAWASASRNLPTPLLTRHLREAVLSHPPPVVRGRRIRLRYAHQGGSNPPLIVVHGNQTEELPANYRRYLERYFRKAFSLDGAPLRLELKTGENPFAGRKNVLTPRQLKRRKRLLRHVGKKRR